MVAAKKGKRSMLEGRIDAALADPAQYRVMRRYDASGIEMENVALCRIVDGRCTVCLGDKPGCSGCISVLQRSIP
jgi:hypothetical protein